jgi:putative hydrolase of the HAD superfamily
VEFFAPPFIAKKGLCFDFYNTLVRIVDDEYQEENFELVRSYLIEMLGCSEFSVPNATQIRNMYYHEIDVVYSRKMLTSEHPDVDLTSIWQSVLTREIVPPDAFSTSDGKKKLNELLTAFRSSAIKIFEPIEDAKITLKKLKEQGITIGILSDAQPAYFEKEFMESGIMDFADFRILSVDHGVRKPSEDLFNEALRSSNLPPEEIVFVGDDMFRDIFGAKRIGMSAVYIPSEHGISYYEDCKPDEVIRSIKELLPLFGIEA